MCNAATAQFFLGMAYLEGRGVEQDIYRAAAWFQSAALKGHARAQMEYAVLCGSQYHDLAEFKLTPFQKAAIMQLPVQTGLREAIFLLGIMHREGDGVRRDPRKYWECLQTASSLGDLDAKHAIQQYTAFGRGRAERA